MISTKKVFCGILLVSALVITANFASAQTTKNSHMHRPPSNVKKFTPEQQTCINNARKTQQAAMKSAQSTFNATTKDALATKQATIKSAQEAFNTATAAALAKKQTAIKDAQKIKDLKSRMAAIKSANDAYNNDSTVKSARPAYEAAIKVANDAYNNDSTVKAAKPDYQAAIKSARTNLIAQCTKISKPAAGGASILQSVEGLFEKTTSSLLNAFHL